MNRTPQETIASDGKTKPKRNDTKRTPIACSSCHSLKVKCMPSNPDDLSAPCVRCLKTKRTCEIDLNHSRKRRRKPDGKVAELEQQVETLKNQLKVQQGGSTSNNSPLSTSSDTAHHPNDNSHPYNSVSPHFYQQNTIDQRFGTRTSLYAAPNKDIVPDAKSAKIPSGDGLTRAQVIDKLMDPNILTQISNSVTSTAERRINKIQEKPVDVINAGLLTLEEAKYRLKLYHESIYTTFPLVKVPTDFDSFRKLSPLLFTTVMSLSSVVQPNTDPSDLDRDIELETLSLKQVVNEFLLVGNKTMELLKCLTLLSVWYNTPELFHHRRYHIITSLCVNMVQDLGLTGRPYYVVSKNEGSFTRATLLEDPQKDEYRSLVLGIYSSSLGYSLFLRRRLQVHWSPYMEESYQHLKNCDNPNFKNIAIFAKLCSVMERINLHVDAKDESNYILIEYMNQEIQTYRDEMTLDKDIVYAFSASVEAYLYAKFNSKDFILKSYDATTRCVDHFARLSPEKKAAVPVLIFGRLMYCFALLLKNTNLLKLDFNYQSLKMLLDSLNVCYEKYRKSHMMEKMRLLFYFYLTTFAKNEDIFNNIVEAPSGEAMAKSVQESNGATIRGRQPSVYQIPNQPPLPNLSPHLWRRPSSLSHAVGKTQEQYESMPYSNNIVPKGGVGSNNMDAPPSHTTSNANTAPIPQQTSGQQLPQVYGEEMPAELNTEQAAAPYLDTLSDAAIKGFNEFPYDMLSNQNEFWKMFDYKDDQFFL